MKYILVIAFTFFGQGLFSQGKTERRLFEKFQTVCNAYKTLPLQVELSLTKRSNIPLDESDSLSMEGFFDVQKKGAYIRMGDTEQIITDTIVLIVMGSIQHMVVSEANADADAMVNKMVSLPLGDSSIKVFAYTYKITQEIMGKEFTMLKISNRQNVYNSDLPVDIVTLIYHTKTNEPQQIQTTKRSLVNKSSHVGANLLAITLSIPGKGDYLIKEDVSTYVYKSIEHSADKKLPVILSDRIMKDATGSYVPVEAYESYVLTTN